MFATKMSNDNGVIIHNFSEAKKPLTQNIENDRRALNSPQEMESTPEVSITIGK